MIRLTNAYTDSPIWINPDHIVDIGEGICKGEKATYITTVCYLDVNGLPMQVNETPEEVARKVMEYRMTIEKYRIGLELEKPHLWEKQRKKMLHLAGLEEQKDE